MSGNSTSLYSNASSNGSVSSNNLTTLYPSTGAAIVPTTPYGNANVVALLAAGSDGGNTIGNISATGNITGNYFIGNGSQLTGLIVSAGTQIVNGNSNVSVGASGNVTVGVTGTSNVAIFAPNGLYVANLISATGNVVASNVVASSVNSNTVYNNGTGVALQSNARAQLQYSNSAASPVDQTNLGDGSRLYVDSSGAAFESNVTGTVRSVVLDNNGNVSATGNITGTYFLGNGSQLSGLPATYSNANVATFLANFGSNTISTTGNITGGYILGNGSQLTGLPATYGNANVADFLPTYTGDLNPGNVAATGNVSGAFLKTTGATGNIQGANYISGNSFVGGVVSMSGNIIGSYFIGNGSQLTGLPAGYSNTNAASFLASFGSNSISTTGNVTAGYFVGNGSQLTGLPDAYSNTNAASFLASFGSNNVSTTGNVTAGYFVGNGSQLTGLPAGYANSNAASFLAAFGSNAISTTGNVTTGNLNVQNDAVITGNLTVNGNTIFVNSNVVTINDKFINLANNAANPTQADGGGIGIGPIAGEYATLTFNSTNNNWNTNIPLSVTGNVTGNYFVGNGSALTAITGGNVTGTVANATYALNANAATYSDQANVANTANAVAGGNVSGQVANALVAGTVYTAAQPNITSVGTLTSLTATGNISTTGNVTGNYFLGNGSQLTGISTSPGGSPFQFQYNNSGAFGGIPNTNYYSGNSTIEIALSKFEATGVSGIVTVPGTAGYVSVTGNVIAGNVQTGGVVSATGNVTGNYFLGNGSQLTGLAAGNAAGANTQIQYNNGNAFAGNAAMTFDQTTGNTTLSNVIIGTSGAGNADLGGNAQRINTSNAYSGILTNTTGYVSGQIVIGNGYFGNLNHNNLNIAAARAGKVVIWDSANVAESGGVGIRYNGLTVMPQITISNVASTATLVRGGVGGLTLGGGASANTWSQTSSGISAVLGFNQFLGVGQPNTTVALGNVTLQGAAASLGQAIIYAGSNVNNLVAVAGQVNNSANVTNVLGMSPYFLGTPTTTPTNVFGYYMPGTTGTYGVASSSGMRAATNYYFLRNDDAVAQTQLGSLRSYNEFRYSTATTGTFALDKTNAQVQYIAPTGAVTISGYSNMVTSLSDSVNTDYEIDTLTVIVQQGATPYAVNLPAASSFYVYANGVNTIPAVANSTTVFTVVAYDNGGSQSFYTTVSSTEPTLSLTGNITGGNILTAGVVSATGNITGSYILGNGSQLTGVVSDYGNANVATFLASFGSNTVSTTGNVTADYFVGNGSQLTGITTSYNDSNVTTLLASFGSNTISTSGNITGGNIIGAGTYLTGINAFGNVAVAGQTTVSADNTTDTLTLVAGTNITITTDAANNKVTITSSGSGGGGETISPLLLMGG